MSADKNVRGRRTESTPGAGELTPADEGRHVGYRSSRETWEFHFLDPREEIAGFARLRFNPRRMRVDGLYLLFHQSEICGVYGRPGARAGKGSWEDWQLLRDCRAGDLSLRPRSAFGPWEVNCEGLGAGAGLLFEPAAEPWALDSGDGAGGYSQAGGINGWVGFDGDRRWINARAVRLHTWGRPANTKRREAALFACFGNQLCAWVSAGGTESSEGKLMRAGKEAAVREASLDPAARVLEAPRELRIGMETAKSGACRIDGIRRALLPIPGLVGPRRLALYELSADEIEGCGIGLLETRKPWSGPLERIAFGAEVARAWGRFGRGRLEALRRAL